MNKTNPYSRITTGLADLVQNYHYFPYGMMMSDISTSSTDNRFRYNGKEYQNDLGLEWYDYGARMYDPALARWHSVDPMAERYSSWSPYTYCANNPIRYIEPDGKRFWEAKNIRDARKEGRKYGVKPEIWKDSHDKKWASITYPDSYNAQRASKIDGIYCKVYKPEGKSWAEAYDDNIGQYVKDGSNDPCNAGGTTKEGWIGAGAILATMTSAGTLLEAAGIVDLSISTASFLNSVDELGKNKQDKGLIEQQINDPTAKKLVKAAKLTTSTSSVIYGVGNMTLTVTNPMQLGNLFFESITIFDNIYNKDKNDKK